jgi:hypothetical protein
MYGSFAQRFPQHVPAKDKITMAIAATPPTKAKPQDTSLLVQARPKEPT